jgi:hypothetical protein
MGPQSTSLPFTGRVGPQGREGYSPSDAFGVVSPVKGENEGRELNT